MVGIPSLLPRIAEKAELALCEPGISHISAPPDLEWCDIKLMHNGKGLGAAQLPVHQPLPDRRHDLRVGNEILRGLSLTIGHVTFLSSLVCIYPNLRIYRSDV